MPRGSRPLPLPVTFHRVSDASLPIDSAAVDRGGVVDRIRSLLREGAPWAASDVFRAAAAGPDEPELLYWGALAHARAGAAERARALLEQVIASAGVGKDVRREALSLSGRLWKDRIDRTPAVSPAGLDAARRARDAYVAAFAVDEHAYPGVNAASLSMLIGDRREALSLAARLIARSDHPTGVQTAWDEATRGEALLLVGRVDEARVCYGRACALAPRDTGSIASMRRQLALIERVLPQARALRDALPAANVIGFAGHMIDRPGRPIPRFPPMLESTVATTLRQRLHTLHRPIVYSSVACGADLLFVEAAFAMGAEVNIVLPCDRDDFVRTSVAFAGDGWVERFDRALQSATRIVQATEERYLGDDVLFEYAQLLVEGLVVLRAAQLDTEPVTWFVLDDVAPSRIGGTSLAYERWTGAGRKAEVFALDRLRNSSPIEPPDARVVAAPMPVETNSADRPQRALKVTLFADVAGFGRVHDAQAPLFHSRFLRLVAEQIAALATPPLEANTWGDALYVVFEEARDGAEFGLGLIDRMKTVDWVEAGLSETSGIRIALHTGPVFCAFDPIVGRDNYFGTSVTKTARIEPVTPPGLVYASEAFVATLAARGAPDYVFAYVGELALAKNYGTSRIYHVERR